MYYRCLPATVYKPLPTRGCSISTVVPRICVAIAILAIALLMVDLETLDCRLAGKAEGFMLSSLPTDELQYESGWRLAAAVVRDCHMCAWLCISSEWSQQC